MNLIVVVALIFGYLGLMAACAAMLVFAVQVRRLLRQFRKFAAQFPPYPVYADKEGEQKDATSVQINDGWDEEAPGRD